ncbi:MAG: GNAT family N-acetyltransferase [Thermodesulfobacteriota bacterium]|nr:GNAT family N-acetyltransferase [Thermodesulfobacteriota bacterium]
MIANSRELETIKEPWDELYKSIAPPQGHPFNCHSWLFPYAKMLESQGSSLQIFTVFERDRLLGIAPLQFAGKSLFGHKRIQFIGHLFSDYCDFIYCTNRGEIVVETLLRHWQTIFGNRVLFDLNLIHESSSTRQLLVAAVRDLGGQIQEIPWEKAPALDLMLKDDAKTHTAEGILSKKHCRQRIKEMDKLGKVRFSVIRADDGLESHLERLFFYHRLRWDQKNTYVHSMNKEVREVYKECIREMAKEGHAEVVSLNINGLPYAYAIALKKDDCFYYLMPAHNIFSRYSPGTSLLYYILRYVKTSGYRELDFTIGEEPYKYRFSNVVRQNCRIFFTFGTSRVFEKTVKVIDHVRKRKRFVENIRSLRERTHQANHRLRKCLVQRAAQLKSLDRTAIRRRIKSTTSGESCYIYKLDVDDVVQPERLEINLRVEEISAVEAIKFICLLHHCDSPAIWGGLLKRELEGAECYGTYVDDNLAHTSWVTDEKSILISEIGGSLELEEGACCIFDCNTLPEYRGRGAYPQALVSIAQQRKTAGYKALYIYALSSNVSSTKGIEKVGFKIAEVRPQPPKPWQFWM